MRRYPGRGIHGDTVDTIGRQIVAGQYQPGQLLHIDALGDELQISRTAIREAIKVLTAKGMVESRPKRGTVVQERSRWNLLDPDLIVWQHDGNPTPAFLRDLAEVRFIVEPAAARLAAQRRDDDDVARIRAALEAMAAAHGSGEEAVAADLAFHRALLLAAKNELLAQMEMVIEAGLRVRDQLVHSGSSWVDPVPEHRAVADAVVAGDPDGAARAMHTLLERGSREAEAAAEERP